MLPYSKIHRRAALRACGAERPAASRCCLGRLGLRCGPLELGLLNDQRYQTNDIRWFVHLHLKVVESASPKPPLYRELCLQRRQLALGEALRPRNFAYGCGCIACLKNL